MRKFAGCATAPTCGIDAKAWMTMYMFRQLGKLAWKETFHVSAPTEAAPTGLLLSDDLIFTSRIVGTARHLGLEVRPVRWLPTGSREQRRAQAGTRCVIVDLAFPGLNLPEPHPPARRRRATRYAARRGLRLAAWTPPP